MTLEVRPEELRVAERVARRIGPRWSAVEVEDLQSQLYLWLVEHKPALARWRDDPKGAGKLFVTLRREALKYCTKETAAQIGQPITRGNFYTRDRVERALPFIFEDWPETQVRVHPQTGQALDSPVEFGNALAIMADISGAFHGLSADVREVLEWRFRDGLTFEEIGEIKEITVKGAAKMVERYVDRLVDKLAGTPLGVWE